MYFQFIRLQFDSPTGNDIFVKTGEIEQFFSKERRIYKFLIVYNMIDWRNTYDGKDK